MTSTRKGNKMNSYEKTVTQAKALGENNDCSVKAVAIACNVAYKVAHKALEFEGRQWGKGCTRPQIIDACKLLGFKVEMITVTAKSVITLERDRALQKGFFLAFVKGHVLAVRNGLVDDHCQGQRRIVKDVHRVTPIGSRKDRKALIKNLFENS